MRQSWGPRQKDTGMDTPRRGETGVNRKNLSGHVRFQVAKTELEAASVSKAVSLAKIQPYQAKCNLDLGLSRRRNLRGTCYLLVSLFLPTHLLFLYFTYCYYCVCRRCVREKGHVCQRKTTLTSQFSPSTVSSGIGP